MAINRLLQICVIVEDVEKATRILTDVYGFPEFRVSDSLNANLQDYTINGEPAPLDNKSGFCIAFGLEWELIEPRSGPLKKWLDERGPGIHHLAVLTDESYEQFGETAKKLSGKDVWLNGVSPTFGMDYSYFDLTKEVGMFLEVYNEDREHPVGFFRDTPPDPVNKG